MSELKTYAFNTDQVMRDKFNQVSADTGMSCGLLFNQMFYYLNALPENEFLDRLSIYCNEHESTDRGMLLSKKSSMIAEPIYRLLLEKNESLTEFAKAYQIQDEGKADKDGSLYFKPTLINKMRIGSSQYLLSRFVIHEILTSDLTRLCLEHVPLAQADIQSRFLEGVFNDAILQADKIENDYQEYLKQPHKWRGKARICIKSYSKTYDKLVEICNDLNLNMQHLLNAYLRWWIQSDIKQSIESVHRYCQQSPFYVAYDVEQDKDWHFSKMGQPFSNLYIIGDKELIEKMKCRVELINEHYPIDYSTLLRQVAYDITVSNRDELYAKIKPYLDVNTTGRPYKRISKLKRKIASRAFFVSKDVMSKLEKIGRDLGIKYTKLIGYEIGLWSRKPSEQAIADIVLSQDYLHEDLIYRKTYGLPRKDFEAFRNRVEYIQNNRSDLQINLSKCVSMIAHKVATRSLAENRKIVAIITSK